MEGLTHGAIVSYAERNVGAAYAAKVKKILEGMIIDSFSTRLSFRAYDSKMARLTLEVVRDLPAMRRPYPATDMRVVEYCKAQAVKELNRKTRGYQYVPEAGDEWLLDAELRRAAIDDGAEAFKCWYSPLEERIKPIVYSGNQVARCGVAEDANLVRLAIESGDVTISVLAKELEDGKIPWLPSTLHSHYRHIVESWYTWKRHMGVSPRSTQ